MVTILALLTRHSLWEKEKLGKGHLDRKQLQHRPPQPRRGQRSPWGVSKMNRVVPGHSGTGGYMGTTGLILRPFSQPWSGEARLPHQTGVRLQGAEFSLFDLRSQHLEEHLRALTMCEENTTPPTQKNTKTGTHQQPSGKNSLSS